MNHSSTILYFTTTWWGSDARALGQALRKQGYSLIECNYEDFFPLHWSSKWLRALRKLAKPLIARDYNRYALSLIESSEVDFLLVFKGMLLEPKTLQAAKAKGIPCYCFYPDVSIGSHGKNIPACLPLYDHIFTTKRFHIGDSELQKLNRNWSLVSHGFDPEVHRPLPLNQQQKASYRCDLSFVGCWSPAKEQSLLSIIEALPELDLAIWGSTWQHASEKIKTYWKQRPAYGDELSLIYQSSTINLGLLSEASGDSLSGDQVTARTWQIPACGGLMLHPQTKELEDYFKADSEVATYRNEDEMIRKIRQLLEDDQSREQLKQAGHERCLSAGYTYESAAQTIDHFHRKTITRLP